MKYKAQIIYNGGEIETVETDTRDARAIAQKYIAIALSDKQMPVRVDVFRGNKWVCTAQKMYIYDYDPAQKKAIKNERWTWAIAGGVSRGICNL